MNTKLFKAFKSAFPYTLPILASYFFLGTAYGIYMSSLGFNYIYPILTAIVIYGGSLEFVAGTMLIATFSPISALFVAVVIQLRHVFYGISMLEKYKGLGIKKLYLIYALSDETFAVNYSAIIPEDVDKGWFYFFVSFLDQCYWIIGTATGAILGNSININLKGIEFVMTAMFIGIFIDQLYRYKMKTSAIIGIMIPILCIMIWGRDNFMLPSVIGMLVLLLALKPVLGKNLDKSVEAM